MVTVKNWQLRHELSPSVNDSVGFYFHKTCENKTFAKISQFTVLNLGVDSYIPMRNGHCKTSLFQVFNPGTRIYIGHVIDLHRHR